MSLSFLGCFALLSLTASGPGSVWVVDDDGGPGIHFTTIQGAIDGAADGDLVLVRSGSYRGFVIDGKSLALTADTGAVVNVFGGVKVKNIDVTRTVSLAGIDIRVDYQTGLGLSNNPGPVLVEDASVLVASFFGGTNHAVTLRSSSSVVFSELDVSFAPIQPLREGHDAVNAVDSILHTFDCSFEGEFSAYDNFRPGGNGLTLLGGFLFASGSTFQGGSGYDGESGAFGACEDGGDGGNGLHVAASAADPFPSVVELDNTFAGGLLGQPTFFPCVAGVDGVGVLLDAGTMQTLTGTSRTLAVSSPIRSGTSATIVVQGLPGELALLIFGPSPAPSFLSILSGTLVVAQPAPLLYLGMVPGNGSLTVPMTVTLPPTDAFQLLHAQAVYASFTSGVVVSDPATVTILDASL